MEKCSLGQAEQPLFKFTSLSERNEIISRRYFKVILKVVLNTVKNLRCLHYKHNITINF